MYEFDLKQAFATLRVRKAKQVTLQLPAGLRTRAVEIAEKFRAEGFEPVISSDPCYGACDTIPGNVVQFGHSRMYPGETIFVETPNTRNATAILKEAARKLKGKNVCVAATIQHLPALKGAKKILSRTGKKVIIGRTGRRATYGGQVLGCDFGALAKADDYLLICSGMFHPLGASLKVGRPVLVADPLMCEVRRVDAKKLLSQRAAVIERAKRANLFGIMVSTKKGQKREALARRIASLLKKHSRKHLLISGDDFAPSNLLGINVDCFVCTACPRIALDDSANYHAPVLTPYELEIALGLRRWEDYLVDEFVQK